MSVISTNPTIADDPKLPSATSDHRQTLGAILKIVSKQGIDY